MKILWKYRYRPGASVRNNVSRIAVRLETVSLFSIYLLLNFYYNLLPKTNIFGCLLVLQTVIFQERFVFFSVSFNFPCNESSFMIEVYFHLNVYLGCLAFQVEIGNATFCKSHN